MELRKSIKLFLLLTIPALNACSLGSLWTTPALMGSALGSAGGVGVGYLIGDQIGKKTENMALAGGIGSGLGMIAGAMVSENMEKQAHARQVVIREMRMISDNQKEIDSLREQMTESSTWGRSEVLPWNQRYWTESYQTPYEGIIK